MPPLQTGRSLPRRETPGKNWQVPGSIDLSSTCRIRQRAPRRVARCRRWSRVRWAVIWRMTERARCCIGVPDDELAISCTSWGAAARVAVLPGFAVVVRMAGCAGCRKPGTSVKSSR